MTSNKFILIFLGFIIVIVLILTSGRISSFLRARFGKYIPETKIITEEITPTPFAENITETPAPTYAYSNTNKSTDSSQIPATGPNDALWLILGISLIGGLSLRKFAGKSTLE